MSKALKKNRKKLLTLALCKNHNNVVLARKKYKEKNPYPDAKPPYKVTTSANRDGVILTKGTKSKELADNIKIFDKKMQSKFKNIFTTTDKAKTIKHNKKQQKKQQKKQGKGKNSKSKFESIFDNGFPFKNSNAFSNWPFNSNQ